jgi:hypothetical protein
VSASNDTNAACGSFIGKILECDEHTPESRHKATTQFAALTLAAALLVERRALAG